MNRRDFILTTSTGALFATTTGAAAEGHMQMQMQGPINVLQMDPNPLENEFEKYAKCPYCGMDRKQFSHTRHLIVYENNMVDATCSLHCAAISLAISMTLGPVTIYAGDNSSADEVKPLADTAAMTYVIDESKPGTMTAVSKFAYTDASAITVGEKVDFQAALTRTYLDMAADTQRIRQRRAEKAASQKG